MKHQTADMLSRLRTTGTVQSSIEDEIPELGITTSTSRKMEVRVMYMQHHNVSNDKNGIGIPYKYAIAT